jgi:hypothetical protein
MDPRSFAVAPAFILITDCISFCSTMTIDHIPIGEQENLPAAVEWAYPLVPVAQIPCLLTRILIQIGISA